MQDNKVTESTRIRYAHRASLAFKLPGCKPQALPELWFFFKTFLQTININNTNFQVHSYFMVYLLSLCKRDCINGFILFRFENNNNNNQLCIFSLSHVLSYWQIYIVDNTSILSLFYVKIAHFNKLDKILKHKLFTLLHMLFTLNTFFEHTSKPFLNCAKIFLGLSKSILFSFT